GCTATLIVVLLAVQRRLLVEQGLLLALLRLAPHRPVRRSAGPVPARVARRPDRPAPGQLPSTGSSTKTGISRSVFFW
ncbi:hypothetical protein ABZT03_25705, partial [Streptomyces sp. NPDC005574]|uniref:hypothetical protein n=1 Tax=Streptomyces sp. NPDC005574 TaxID=3156891 RepID=UPI0033AE51D7